MDGIARYSGNANILGAGVAFVALSLLLGLGRVPMNEEIIFLGSLGLIVFLMRQLLADLDPGRPREIIAIAFVDTMADSPRGQVAMVPMLAWIAKETPRNRKATYFAVMAAFTNLALSASQLGTQYLNK